MNSLEDRLANELTRQSDALPTGHGDATRVDRDGRRRLLARRAGVMVAAAVIAVIVLMPVAFMYGTVTESGPVDTTDEHIAQTTMSCDELEEIRRFWMSIVADLDNQGDDVRQARALVNAEQALRIASEKGCE